MDFFAIFQLKKMDEISAELGITLNGVSVPEMRKLSKQLCKIDKDHVRLFDVCQAQLHHKVYQVRFLSSLITGQIAFDDIKYLELLRTSYCFDENWRVQEANAKAFDYFCEKNAYKNSLEIIYDWINDKNENVRRAVTEGLRVWTSKPYFKDNPEEAIKILSKLKSDESPYVRKSVANCLSDISKHYPILVLDCFKSWDYTDERSHFIIKRGCRHLINSHPDQCNAILGFASK